MNILTVFSCMSEFDSLFIQTLEVCKMQYMHMDNGSSSDGNFGST